jgi:hypothetical protein
MRRTWIRKLVLLVVIAVVFGWLYGRLSPHLFPRETRFGFFAGVLHGAVMPLALPTLLEGRDVELFGANNTGRGYKIGYICGINLCGLIFFGAAFWNPRNQSCPTGPEQGTRTHISQLRKISTTSNGPPAQ